MPDSVGLLVVAGLGLSGAVLLRESVSGRGTEQTVSLMAGAAFISLGFVTLVFVVKNWLRWRKYYELPESTEMSISRERPQLGNASS